MMLNLAQFQPTFQAALRPVAQKWAEKGMTANQLLMWAVLISVGIGGLLSVFSQTSWLFYLLIVGFVLVWLLHTLSVILAKEFMQESALGNYLHDVGWVVSEAALCLPLAFVLGGFEVGLWIWLAMMVEFLAVLGVVHGFNGRRDDGVMGRAERGLCFVVLALWYVFSGSLNIWAHVLLWCGIALLMWTAYVRWQNGLRAQP